jgi:hypothetical protein
MAYKRRVLSALGKDELLEVTAKMSVDELRGVIARSTRVSAAKTVSESMPHDKRKEIRATCDLDASGKEKQALVGRIIAGAANEPSRNGGGALTTVGSPVCRLAGVLRMGSSRAQFRRRPRRTHHCAHHRGRTRATSPRISTMIRLRTTRPQAFQREQGDEHTRISLVERIQGGSALSSCDLTDSEI